MYNKPTENDESHSHTEISEVGHVIKKLTKLDNGKELTNLQQILEVEDRPHQEGEILEETQAQGIDNIYKSRSRHARKNDDRIDNSDESRSCYVEGNMETNDADESINHHKNGKMVGKRSRKYARQRRCDEDDRLVKNPDESRIQ